VRCQATEDLPTGRRLMRTDHSPQSVWLCQPAAFKKGLTESWGFNETRQFAVKELTLKKWFLILVATLGVSSCFGPIKFKNSDLASRFYDQGDYANAIAYYMKSIAENDQSAETFYGLAMAFYQHGDREEAMLALEKCVEKDPKNASAFERLAAVNLDLGDIPKAEVYCRKAIRLDSEFVEAYNTMGHIFFESGQLDSAQSYFSDVLALSKSLRWKTIADRSFVAYNEEQAEANNGLGEICISRAFLEQSLSYFSAASLLAPHWETPWFNKGRAYDALGNSRAAEVAYRRTIDLAPSNTLAYKNLAKIFRRSGKNPEAMTLYRLALRTDSTDADIYFGLAELYERQGDKRQAAEVYDRAVDHVPGDMRTYSRAGYANLAIGEYDRAIELFGDIIGIKPEDAAAHNGLGEAYRATRDTALARMEFEQAVASDTLFALPLRNLGALYMDAGNEAFGVQYYIRAARLGDGQALEFLRARGYKIE
jgi:tetratricopeptide (TPR) repeat protein